jgi:hypothetical protein
MTIENAVLNGSLRLFSISRSLPFSLKDEVGRGRQEYVVSFVPVGDKRNLLLERCSGDSFRTIWLYGTQLRTRRNRIMLKLHKMMRPR